MNTPDNLPESEQDEQRLNLGRVVATIGAAALVPGTIFAGIEIAKSQESVQTTTIPNIITHPGDFTQGKVAFEGIVVDPADIASYHAHSAVKLPHLGLRPVGNRVKTITYLLKDLANPEATVLIEQKLTGDSADNAAVLPPDTQLSVTASVERKVLGGHGEDVMDDYSVKAENIEVIPAPANS